MALEDKVIYQDSPDSNLHCVGVIYQWKTRRRIHTLKIFHVLAFFPIFTQLFDGKTRRGWQLSTTMSGIPIEIPRKSVELLQKPRKHEFR
jgi:hypothetical protein